MSARAGGEWAQRWTALLADAPGDIARRARQGQALVRSGRVTDVRVAGELESAGVRLFPTREELDVSCACGHGLCVHAAALWQAAGDLLADDPFLLPAVRGRGRQRVLDDVAGRRGSAAPPAPSGLALDALDPAGWWDARAPIEDAAPPPAPRVAAPALRALGDPPGWAGGISAYDLFRPLVARGAAWAARLLTEVDGTDE